MGLGVVVVVDPGQSDRRGDVVLGEQLGEVGQEGFVGGWEPKVISPGDLRPSDTRSLSKSTIVHAVLSLHTSAWQAAAVPQRASHSVSCLWESRTSSASSRH